MRGRRRSVVGTPFPGPAPGLPARIRDVDQYLSALAARPDSTQVLIDAVATACSVGPTSIRRRLDAHRRPNPAGRAR
ncbi:hypothetical protein DMP17_22440 [Pseudonocardia sp. TMWB2A]